MTNPHMLNPMTVEMTTRNIRLTGRFLAEVMDDPDILNEIPDDAIVVLIPPDDPELAQYNIDLMTATGTTSGDIFV
jgi:hypothetical protein